MTEKDGVKYTKYQPQMKSTHKLLFPQMAPIHFSLLSQILNLDGYDTEVLSNGGASVIQCGQQYVHNDACYPALVVIGQFIEALKSGKYDVNKTALVITQTGGGCRASNYIFMLRKALMKAGLSHVPVVSLNFSVGLEGGLDFNLKLLKKIVAAILLGDLLMSLSNQTRPYEVNKGDTDTLTQKWDDKLRNYFDNGYDAKKRPLRYAFIEIVKSYNAIELKRESKIKVGIVGEIYVKFSPIGNNNLEAFLHSEGCEVCVPGLMGFIQYSIYNMINDINLYGGSRIKRIVLNSLQKYVKKREKYMLTAIRKNSVLTPPSSFAHTKSLADGLIGLGAKMGEGWLLTAEMAELIESGFANIVCTQPFGCLPNHIVGKGMISKLREKFGEANIVPIDYDPSATPVNQINRIKLMLSEAKPV